MTTDELEQFRKLAKQLRPDDRALDSPPADLFARIERAAVPASDAPPARVERPAPLVPRRRALPRLAFAAAAAAVVIAGAAIALASSRGGDTIVAKTALGNAGLPVAAPTANGTARVVRNDDGSFTLKLDLAALPDSPNGFYELWIIDTKVQGMVSLGPLRSDGRYRLPPSVDWRQFPIVDVSVEPVDGVPTHSGASVLRGTLA